MVVCPLCEHAQETGIECEVCGRRMPDAPEITAPVPILPELEPTLAPETREVPEAPVPGLEVNAHAPVAAPTPELIPDLERSAAAPVDVAIEPLPDVDREMDGLPVDAPTPFPVLVVCRYCRTEAQLGEKLCARCGMRLPTIALVPAPSEDDAPRLCGCGAPVRSPRCPVCGARNT